MGEIANDMVDGACCSQCGIYFTQSHGYPVLCEGDWNAEYSRRVRSLNKGNNITEADRRKIVNNMPAKARHKEL